MNRVRRPQVGRLLFLAAVCLLGSLSTRADAPAVSATATPPVETTTPAPITNPAQVAAHYRQVLARPEFQESQEPDINARFKDLLSQWFLRLGAKLGEFKYASRMPAIESLLMAVLVVVSVAGLFYIMLRLTRRRGGMETESATGVPGQKTFRPPEFYDEEIRQAIGAGDWHGAWLAAWLQLLARLEHRQLVAADRSRTNREYLAQLRDQRLPDEAFPLLARMVDDYDRVIYGVRPIDEAGWTAFRERIDEITLRLGLRERLTKELA